MDISPISNRYADELGIRHLQVFDILMRERSLTRSAEILDVTQPALSKTLARLRSYFDDPLFVRVSLRMEPTAKALELAGPIAAVLDGMRALRSDHVSFDPATSRRTFKFCVVDAGVIRLLPPLMDLLSAEAPHVRLRAMQLDAQHLPSWLESGAVDFAMGAFPGLDKPIRREPLWVEDYVCVVRQDHPRIGPAPTLAEYAAERHVVVSTQGTGHAHREAERAIERAVPAENIICSVPMFTAAAIIAEHTDAVATVTRSTATTLGPKLSLMPIVPPIDLPTIQVSQYWHERFHRDPGSQWIRSVFKRLFKRPVRASTRTLPLAPQARQS